MLVTDIPDVKGARDLNRPIQTQTSYRLVSVGTTGVFMYWQTPGMRTEQAAAPSVTTTSTPRPFRLQLRSGSPSFPQTASSSEWSRFRGNPPLHQEATWFSIRFHPMEHWGDDGLDAPSVQSYLRIFIRDFRQPGLSFPSRSPQTPQSVTLICRVIRDLCYWASYLSVHILR